MYCRIHPEYGVDFVAGCLEADDTRFREECIAIVDCAKTNGCGYGERGGEQCFCGTVELSACQAAGAANGPCQDEWWAGARTDSLADLFGNLGVVALPSGAANFLLECERDYCPTQCTP